MEKTFKCKRCQGSGQILSGPPLGNADGPQYHACYDCNGKGYVTIDITDEVIEENPNGEN